MHTFMYTYVHNTNIHTLYIQKSICTCIHTYLNTRANIHTVGMHTHTISAIVTRLEEMRREGSKKVRIGGKSRSDKRSRRRGVDRERL